VCAILTLYGVLHHPLHMISSYLASLKREHTTFKIVFKYICMNTCLPLVDNIQIFTKKQKQNSKKIIYEHSILKGTKLETRRQNYMQFLHLVIYRCSIPCFPTTIHLVDSNILFPQLSSCLLSFGRTTYVD
jgi:hypothetical protein